DGAGGDGADAELDAVGFAPFPSFVVWARTTPLPSKNTRGTRNEPVFTPSPYHPPPHRLPSPFPFPLPRPRPSALPPPLPRRRPRRPRRSPSARSRGGTPPPS